MTEKIINIILILIGSTTCIWFLYSAYKTLSKANKKLSKNTFSLDLESSISRKISFKTDSETIGIIGGQVIDEINETGFISVEIDTINDLETQIEN
jgi:hypothetical protein